MPGLPWTVSVASIVWEIARQIVRSGESVTIAHARTTPAIYQNSSDNAARIVQAIITVVDQLGTILLK
jgi:hypothetical protein